jgi:predicted transcriptional regulator
LKQRDNILIQMEILASLFASPKILTRICQSCNINMSRVDALIGPLISHGLVRREVVEGREVYSITDEGYRLYKDWLEVWRKLSL